jgi:catechol 2,3-dioxygenase-like lactoylglutathione lyase family enzyme
MRIEHFALNVADPVGMADWYVRNCGFRIHRQQNEPPYMVFLGDTDGHVLIELYHRTDKPCWTRQMFQEPLLFHVALSSNDLAADVARLTAAGASVIESTIGADGFGLVMMRDPFGMPLQLCRRNQPFEMAR